MITIAQAEISNVLSKIRSNTFDYGSFSFVNERRDLAGIAALYLVVNERSKKIDLGSTTNMHKRRAEHKSSFNTTSGKMSKAMHEAFAKQKSRV